MMERRRMGGKGLSIVFLIGVLLCAAHCGSVLATTIPLDIVLEGDGHVGYLTLWSDIDWDEVMANPGEMFHWSLPTGPGQPYYGGIEIRAENDWEVVMGHLAGISVQVRADPILNLGFSVTSGDFATAFSFSTPLLTFDPICNAEAYAEAQIGINSGHTLTGSYQGGKAYKALYNDTTTFAHLVNSINSPPWSSWESVGPQPLPGTITSMQSKFQFILSPNAMASGSSCYEIEAIPEPATMLLLGLGGLALIRKRKT